VARAREPQQPGDERGIVQQARRHAVHHRDRERQCRALRRIGQPVPVEPKQGRGQRADHRGGEQGAKHRGQAGQCDADEHAGGQRPARRPPEETEQAERLNMAVVHGPER